MTTDCKHPPARLYAWFAQDPTGPVLCVACCECGTVLKGGVTFDGADEPVDLDQPTTKDANHAAHN